MYFANKTSNLTFNNLEDDNLVLGYLRDVDRDLQNIYNVANPFLQFGTGTQYSVLTYSTQTGLSIYTWYSTIGSWNITGTLLYAGSGATYMGLQPGTGIWMGDPAFLSAPFSVDPNGVLKSHSGRIGGWYIGTSTLSSANLVLDSTNEQIRTSDFVSGALGAGWQIDKNLSEFNDIRARGKFITSVFEYDTISSIGGSLLVANSAILTSNMSSTDAATMIISTDTNFVTGEILRLKDGINDEWLQITSTITAYQYNLSRDKKGDYAANSNPQWKKGTAVVSYGTVSGAGLIFMTASEANSPHIDIVSHTGTPWAGVTTQARLGNLNGYLGYTSDTYGIAIGETTKYLKYDATNGLRVAGQTLLGQLDVSTAGYIASGQTGYNIGTGFYMEYNAGTPRFSIGNSSSAVTLTWDGTKLQVANIQSPDYVATTTGYKLTAIDGLEINTGTIQGTDFIAKLMVYAMMFGN